MSDTIKRIREAAQRAQEDQMRYTSNRLNSTMTPYPKYGDVGLEFEIEGRGIPHNIPYASPDTNSMWVEHNEQSLRGESAEYVCSEPVTMAEAPEMIEALFAAFEENKAKINNSNRCSTHVHLNCSTLSHKPITSLIVLFTMVEEAVTNWCGPDRVSNPFCMRAIDSHESLETWQEYIDSGSWNFQKKVNKYSALNLVPLHDFGSVEFRHLRGADNKEMVLLWLNFLWALREEARTTYRNPMDIAQEVSANGCDSLIAGVIKRQGQEKFWSEVINLEANRGIEQMLRRGFLKCQPMLFSVQWGIEVDDVCPSGIEKKDAKPKKKSLLGADPNDPFILER